MQVFFKVVTNRLIK